MPSKKSSQFLSVSVSLSLSLSQPLPQSLRRAVVGVLCVAALVGAVLLPVAPANAATRFTNGERMEGSFFDHLADGLAGDPNGGDGVVNPELSSTTTTQTNDSHVHVNRNPSSDRPLHGRWHHARLLSFLQSILRSLR